MKKLLFILIVCDALCALAQRDTLPYNKKEEIIYDNKRYRRWNNYVSFGAGKAYSNLRVIDQSVIDVDYQFHLQRQYFQVGVMMSGDEFLSNNNMQGHVCYGWRRERDKTHFAVFGGPSYAYFVTAPKDTNSFAVVNQMLGGYLCVQAIYKFKYDVGIGAELFADINKLQQIVGAKIIFYFSGAYRGEKRGRRR